MLPSVTWNHACWAASAAAWRFCSVMSRAIFEAPMTVPDASRTGERFGRPVHVADRPVLIGGNHRVADAAERDLEPRLLGGQRRRVALLLGDVPGDFRGADDRTRCIADRGALRPPRSCSGPTRLDWRQSPRRRCCRA